MSADADYADAPRIPPIPPRPPRRPAAPPADEDPKTTVLRPVPAEPADPAAPAAAPPAARQPLPAEAAPASTPPVAPAPPTAPAAPPAPVAPPRPSAPPTTPPRPRAEPPAAPPPPTDAPRSFRDTAAFHLANSASLWDEPAARTSPAPAQAPPPTAPAPAPTPPPPAPTPWPATPVGPTGVEPAPRRSLAERLPSTRIVAAAVSLVLGIGLMGGAAAGSWLTESPAKGTPTPEAAFAKGQDAWRNTPVDTLFPRTVEGLAAGPGGADRTWIRIAVAPDADCTAAVEGPLAKELAPAGCARLLRATYVDATRTDVITVGAQTTKADRSGMMDLNARFSTHNLATRTALMPLPLAARGTPAEGFGPAQRASWTVRILTDIPVVVYAVSGFADGREVTDPQPADAAVQPGTATAPAESGLGHDAKGLADKVTATFRAASGIPASPTEEAP
ncbi:hypothetical protein [Streptomyces noursei]|uniref:hypothetical protein n=1 Tax=Streptomyces noursei TaxID=1971 RepID=UPI0023B78D3C|nr:hypothetical protein [Streptomyces noursei]